MLAAGFCLIATLGCLLMCLHMPKLGSVTSTSNLATIGLDGGVFSLTPDLECWSYTGGSCSALGCNARRNATCIWSWSLSALGGTCVCSPDTCASTNGDCMHARNTIVATNFSIASVSEPDFHLRATGCGHGHSRLQPEALGVVDSRRVPPNVTLEETRFALLGVAGTTSSFMLVPMAFPTCVIMMAGLPSVPSVGDPSVTGVDKAAFRFVSEPNVSHGDEAGTFAIFSEGLQGRHLWKPNGIVGVHVWSGVVKTAGLWRADPPLPSGVVVSLHHAAQAGCRHTLGAYLEGCS